MPIDGSSAQELATFEGNPFRVFISPNLEYLAYERAPNSRSNDRELHLATIDGSRDVVYAQGHLMQFWAWSPDSVNFIFGSFSSLVPQWGSVCGSPIPLLDLSDTPARRSIDWADSTHFLFLKGNYIDYMAVFRLGEVGGSSILIGL